MPSVCQVNIYIYKYFFCDISYNFFLIIFIFIFFLAISIGGISNLFQYVRNERFLIIPNNSILNGSDSLNNNINLEEREQTKSLN